MHTNLTVIYTDHLDDCRAFYSGMGLDFGKEQHGQGPEHYAAVLDGGAVFELYPSGDRAPTGRLRLGFTMHAGPVGHPVGRHVLTDPDGRTVVLTVTTEELMTEQEARTAVQQVLGETAHPEVTVYPAGNVSLTVRLGAHVATVDGHPESGWGWTLDPGEDVGFSGHDDTAPTLEAALTAARDAATT
ncbi:glyoxalase/bleomycin resistance/dioxygenase family protein [Streptomyces sp. ITFR-16]|uniref:glyoxalase/bleomycin resistance/dioxygenase family protein n=1 Tax=Streptomyces sp. ITFR-16 TaxID=3075198 RepID=UPI00288B2C8F|nr:glyoxalase/bleomycin resistance/dioxygenase family protein [Streptomyces sp. ITFR-16]WNI20427.1 glyoxalase/bleomycin resistance/dioxygenase family protein [Streptomyces sp. ITFR-16]